MVHCGDPQPGSGRFPALTTDNACRYYTYMGRSRHPNKEIEAALKYAEEHGWTVNKVTGSGHAWGRAKCKRGHREHQFSIWSTPRSTENHAKQIRRRIDRCQEDE